MIDPAIRRIAGFQFGLCFQDIQRGVKTRFVAGFVIVLEGVFLFAPIAAAGISSQLSGVSTSATQDGSAASVG